MKQIEITPDLIIAIGMSVALICAIVMGADNAIATGIAGALSGYLGQVVLTTDDKKKEQGGGQNANN